MLDLNDPQTTHIIHAAVLLDRLYRNASAMIVDRSLERSQHLEECGKRLAELRALAQEHFQASNFIYAAIAELETVILSLSTAKGWTADDGHCPTCGTHLDPDSECDSCLNT